MGALPTTFGRALCNYTLANEPACVDTDNLFLPLFCFVRFRTPPVFLVRWELWYVQTIYDTPHPRIPPRVSPQPILLFLPSLCFSLFSLENPTGPPTPVASYDTLSLPFPSFSAHAFVPLCPLPAPHPMVLQHLWFVCPPMPACAHTKHGCQHPQALMSCWLGDTTAYIYTPPSHHSSNNPCPPP